jgi:hypothetical protein
VLPRWFNSQWAKVSPTLDELGANRLTASDIDVMTEVEKKVVCYILQTNLRVLVNCVLRPGSKKFLPFNERTHGKIFDSFLRPDPEKNWDEWSPIKERVTLAFRGATKSTIVGGFLTQLILCDPDIRVLVLSGKLVHAKTIIGLSRQSFVSNEVLRRLFHDWMISESENTGDSFTSPKRNQEFMAVERDPTLSIATFESVKAGGHFELLLFDDCTNEINCATPELVDKNIDHYDDTDGLIEPGGYRHFFGTRWAPDETDLPEVIRQRGVEHAAEHNGELNTEYTFVPVWELKDQYDLAVQERDKKNRLTVEDVNLAWPEKLKGTFLWPKYRANPQKFNGQYLLRWRGIFLTESFTEEMLINATRPFAEGMPLPHDRFLVINFDMGGIFTGRRPKVGYDFSCGMAAMFELSTRRLFTYDAFLEVFSSSEEAANMMVQFYARQLKIGPVGICEVEEANGIRMLEGELKIVADKAKVPFNLVYCPTENTENSKNVGIAMLHGPIRKGQIQFSSTLPHREEIFKQFINWSPIKGRRRKDDGPDCLANIWKRHSADIHPNMVSVMQSSGQEHQFVPEVPQEVDPHADEMLNADIDLLRSMTVIHAN